VVVVPKQKPGAPEPFPAAEQPRARPDLDLDDQWKRWRLEEAGGWLADWTGDLLFEQKASSVLDILGSNAVSWSEQ
jgi:hypothetical protein